jgi:hypothetical protein
MAETSRVPRLVLSARAPYGSRMNHRALPFLRTLAALAVLLLAACGGGDMPDEEETVPTRPVNCQERPERCR